MDRMTVKILPVTGREFFLWIIKPAFYKKNIYISLSFLILFSLGSIYIVWWFIFPALVLLLLILLALLSFFFDYRKLSKLAQNSTVAIDENEIQITETLVNVAFKWSSVRKIKIEPEFMAISLKERGEGVVIVKRCFPSELEAEEFFKKAEQYWKEAQKEK